MLTAGMHKRWFHIVLASSTALALGALCPTLPAFAQSTIAPATPPNRPATGLPSHPPGLEEVTVTARRRSENLQKVPQAVTVLSGAAIAQQRIVTTADLNSKVPSLAVTSISTTRDSSTFTIRGQGEGFAGSEPAVIIYFDEVPTSGVGPGLLYDLQSLQVLKGPQGTLFGRNTTGGAILLGPQLPTNAFGGYLDGTYGNYNERRAQGALNVPIINDKLMARFAFDINARDGFTTDAITGRKYDNRDYKAYRLGILARPNNSVENYLLFNYTTSNTNDSGNQLVSINANPATTDIPVTLYYPGIVPAFATQKALGIRQVEHDLQNGVNRVRDIGITNTTTIHINDDLLIKNIFGYRDFRTVAQTDVDGTTLPILQNYPNSFYGAGFTTEPSTKSFTDELQLQGKSFGQKLTWIVGLYDEYRKPATQDEQDEFTQFAFTPPGILASTYVYQALKQDRSKAAYGQFTYDLSQFVSNLKFTGGVRYTSDWRSQKSSNYPVLVGCVAAAAAGAGYCNAHQTAAFEAPTGTVSLDYQYTPKTLFYVASRRGYKSGGFNVTAPDPSERLFQPEYVTDVELGAKTEIDLDGVVGRINGDLYRGMYTDLQENGYIIANGQELTITQSNGQGIVQGAEIEGQIVPLPNVTLSGFYSYTDAYYTQNEFSGLDLRNLPFHNTPKNKFSLSGTYDFPVPPSIGDVSATLQYAYQSKTYFTVQLIAKDTDPQRGQAGYGLLNAHVDWNHVLGSSLSLSAFGNNLTDQAYKIFEDDSYNITGFSSAVFGEPRTFGFEGRYTF